MVFVSIARVITRCTRVLKTKGIQVYIVVRCQGRRLDSTLHTGVVRFQI